MQEGIPSGLVDVYVREHMLRADQDLDGNMGMQVRGGGGGGRGCWVPCAASAWNDRRCTRPAVT